MSGRCSSRPLATLTTCERHLEATAHGVILSPVVPALPRPTLSLPRNYTRERAAAPSAPCPYPCQPPLPIGYPPSHCFTTHSRLSHSFPRSLAARHARAPACLCIVSPSPRPHPNWADSCGAACAFCSSQLVAAAGSLLFFPLVFPTAQQLACVSLLVCGRTTAMLHTLVGVMMIGKCVRYQHVCNVGVVEGPRHCRRFTAAICAVRAGTFFSLFGPSRLSVCGLCGVCAGAGFYFNLFRLLI